MPLDGTTYKTEPLAKLAPPYAFGNDKLAELEWLLRQPERWNGHKWDFRHNNRHCGTPGCAMGLARAVGLATETGEWFWRQMNIPQTAHYRLFSADDHCYGTSTAKVSPLMVADAIRRYMVSGEV